MDSKASARTLGTLPSFAIVVLAIGLMNHVMVIPPLLQEAKRDAWISVLVTTIPFLIWTSLLYYIMRKTNQQPFLHWMEANYGKTLSGALRIVFIVYLFLIGTLTIKDTTMWTHTSYLPRTPEIVLSASLVLLCCFAAHCGIQAIAIASGILLPFVVVFGDFVMSSNLPAKNYSLLMPMLENGPGPALMGCMYVGGGLVELVIVLLYQHQMKSKVRLWSLWLLAIFLVLLVFGPVTGAIAEFGPFEAARLRYPAYEEWRLVKLGKYIRHVDFLSIYQWLSGAFVRISIALLLLIDLLPASRDKKLRSVWLAAVGIAFVAAVELPFSDMQYSAFLKDIYLPLSLTVVTGIVLLLFGAVLVKNAGGVKRR